LEGKEWREKGGAQKMTQTDAQKIVDCLEADPFTPSAIARQAVLSVFFSTPLACGRRHLRPSSEAAPRLGDPTIIIIIAIEPPDRAVDHNHHHRHFLLDLGG